MLGRLLDRAIHPLYERAIRHALGNLSDQEVLNLLNELMPIKEN